MATKPESTFKRSPRRLSHEAVLRALIRQMSMENPLWGAPRIHGELLKLGFEVAQSSIAKYMVKRRGPLDQHQGRFGIGDRCTPL